MDREGMEEGENFRYLGVIITTDGRMGEEVIHRQRVCLICRANPFGRKIIFFISHNFEFVPHNFLYYFLFPFDATGTCVSVIYFGCVLDESGTGGAKCRGKVASGRKVADAVRSLVNYRNLEFQCTRVLHEAMLMPANFIVMRQCYGRRRRDLE